MPSSLFYKKEHPRIAATTLDTLSRLLGMAREATDAVSACTQVEVKEVLKLPGTECFALWIRLPRNRCPAEWGKVDDPVVPLESNLHTRWQGYCGNAKWDNYDSKIIGKLSNVGHDCTSIERTNCCCQFVDDINMVGRNESKLGTNVGKIAKEDCERGSNSTSRSSYLGCIQRAATGDGEVIRAETEMLQMITKSNVEETVKKLSTERTQTFSSWCYDMKGYAGQCSERQCELANNFDTVH